MTPDFKLTKIALCNQGKQMDPINIGHKHFVASLAQNAKWLLIGIALLGFCLRVWGINFGLPYLYVADEPN